MGRGGLDEDRCAHEAPLSSPAGSCGLARTLAPPHAEGTRPRGARGEAGRGGGEGRRGGKRVHRQLPRRRVLQIDAHPAARERVARIPLVLRRSAAGSGGARRAAGRAEAAGHLEGWRVAQVLKHLGDLLQRRTLCRVLHRDAAAVCEARLGVQIDLWRRRARVEGSGNHVVAAPSRRAG